MFEVVDTVIMWKWSFWLEVYIKQQCLLCNFRLMQVIVRILLFVFFHFFF